MAYGKKPPDSLAVRRAVDAGKIPPVWLWTGPEEYLKEQLFKRIVAMRAGDDPSGLSTDRFRAGDADMGEVISTCRTLPMLSPVRVVLLQNVEGAGKKDRELLIDYTASPSPETTLILTGSRGPQDSLYKRLEKAGVPSAVFWTPFPEQARQWIQFQFKDRGKVCGPDLANELLLRCGGGLERQVPLAELAPEVEKVILSMGDRKEARDEDLEVIGKKADEALLQEVVERTTAGDLPGALRALDGALLFKEINEIRVVAVLTHRVLHLMQVRDLLDAGHPPGEIQRLAGVWRRDWPGVERGAKRGAAPRFRESLDALALADRTLKSRPKNSRLVLEKALLTLCK